MSLNKTPRSFTFAAAVALAIVVGMSTVNAQQSSQNVLEEILRNVVGAATEAAGREIRRNTGIDPLRRGYDPDRSYAPIPGDASEETRRELSQLNEEHDRKIAKLEDELRRKLDKAEAEFRREAGKEDKPEKIREKRAKLQEKVDEAYAKFEEKIGDENERFDEKRDDILSKRRG